MASSLHGEDIMITYDQTTLMTIIVLAASLVRLGLRSALHVRARKSRAAFGKLVLQIVHTMLETVVELLTMFALLAFATFVFGNSTISHWGSRDLVAQHFGVKLCSRPALSNENAITGPGQGQPNAPELPGGRNILQRAIVERNDLTISEAQSGASE
jgi:hypothetical protein